MNKLQDRINTAKNSFISDEVGESTVEMLAQIEMNQDFIAKVEGYSQQLELLKQTSGSGNDWKVHPAYHFDSLGQLKRLLSLWIYLPDTLKTLSGLPIPHTAFNSDSLEAWGSLPYCDALGVEHEGTEPNFEDVVSQAEVLKVYLTLNWLPKVLTQEAWDKKKVIAKAKSLRKGADIRSAMLDEEIKTELGLPSFTV